MTHLLTCTAQPYLMNLQHLLFNPYLNNKAALIIGKTQLFGPQNG